jgi:hypothetical protein
LAKETKKTPLHKDSIFIPLGILYKEDLPEFHINGRKCSKYDYEEHLKRCEFLSKEWLKNKRIKKIIAKINRD